MGEKVFEKVTSDLGTWAGTYVVGYDLGDGNAVIFNGQSIDNGNVVNTTIAENKVTVSTDCAIEIAAVDGGYTLKAKAGYLNGKAAAQNGMKFDSAPATATIVWTDGNPIITSAVGTVLRYNNGPDYNDATKNYSWFRFYKTNSSVQTPVVLFKLTGETPVVCEHVWNEGVVTTAPTCTTAGVKTYTCTKCNATKTEVVPATGHNYVDGVCTVCGAKETVSTGDVYALATELKDGDEVIIYNPGYGKAIKNENDNNWYLVAQEVTPANNEIKTDDTTIVWTAKKNDDGTFSFVNGDNAITAWLSGTFIELTNDANYEGGDTKWNVATGTAANNTFYISSSTIAGSYGPGYLECYPKTNKVTGETIDKICGYSTSSPKEKDCGFQFFVKDENAEVCAHDWQIDQVIPATCTEAGETDYVCSKCSAEKEEPIAALGHLDDNKDGKCDRCGTDLGGTASGYTKVTAAPTDWSGTYLIVFEKTDTTAYAFNGLDVSGNFVETTFANNTIAASEALTACEVLVEKSGTGYTFKLTGGENKGMYLSAYAGRNKIVFSNTATALSVAMENGTVVIKDGEAPFQFNNGATNGQWFRFFGKKNGGQSAIALYKLG